MLSIAMGKASRRSSCTMRMKPARSTIRAPCSRRTPIARRSASGVRRDRFGPGSRTTSGMARRRASSRAPASARSVINTAISPPRRPARAASASAAKLEPRPDAKTPIRIGPDPAMDERKLSQNEARRDNSWQLLAGASGKRAKRARRGSRRSQVERERPLAIGAPPPDAASFEALQRFLVRVAEAVPQAARYEGELGRERIQCSHGRRAARAVVAELECRKRRSGPREPAGFRRGVGVTRENQALVAGFDLEHDRALIGREP